MCSKAGSACVFPYGLRQISACNVGNVLKLFVFEQTSNSKCDISMSFLTGDTLFTQATIATVVWEQQVDPSRRQGGWRGRNRPALSGAPRHHIVNGI